MRVAGLRVAGVYPRVCGGAGSYSRSTLTLRGLSPRVRGSPQWYVVPPWMSRSIPACAGEPSLSRQFDGYRFGLSPRVRGSRSSSDACPAADTRSIPACAGEPSGPACTDTRREVYPRVCGGAVPLVAVLPLCRGLSPRVRGSRISYGGRRRQGPGSIPACAGEPGLPRRIPNRRAGLSPRVRGSPDLAAPVMSMVAVYPRVCGGAARTSFPVDGPSWSIPACAGEPLNKCPGLSRRPVYPRVCGGAALFCVQPLADGGLSPRVRGSLNLDHAR